MSGQPQEPQNPYAAPAPAYSRPQVGYEPGYSSAPTSQGAYGYGQAAVPGNRAWVEQQYGPVATFADRIAPAIVDGVIMALPAVIAAIAAVVIWTTAATADADGRLTIDTGTAVGGGTVVFLGLLLTLALWLWNRVFRMGRTGQSVGKSLFGLRLIGARDGLPTGPGLAFVRELVSGLANSVVYLSYLWMLWDEDRQTLADKAVMSTVIRVAKP